MSIRRSIAIPMTVTALMAAPAFGGLVDVGGGWTASWDASLDEFVDVVSNGVSGDAVFIQKFAEFTQPSENGFFPTIPIVFTQTSPDAVSHIVIDDEIIRNSTGEDWNGFRMQILNGPGTAFNPEMTAMSGGGGPIGFSIDPFTTAQFLADDKQLDIGGGLIAASENWFPGSGANDGQLWINANPALMGDPFRTLVLKETPLPGPAGLALLLLAPLGARRRRCS